MMLWTLALACHKAPAVADSGSATQDSMSAADSAGGGSESGGRDSSRDSAPAEAGSNLLTNPGFELGESWERPEGGYLNSSWAGAGDPIYGSGEVFQPLAGSRSLKVWGMYSGSVPNESDFSLSLTELSAGDQHAFSLQAYTHGDDAVSGDNSLRLFLEYYDEADTLLLQALSDAAIDRDSAPSVWTDLRVEASVPEGAVRGRLGVRYLLSAWESGGSVYLDEASWTSTGTGAVEGERLLVWQDEFSGTELSESKWNHEVFGAYTYNNELQAYTDRDVNSYLEDGKLVIEALRQSYDGADYTSARLNTSGKGDWRYGRFEGYLMVPEGQGTWPALWMLPTEWQYGGWPDSGEIDIMEHVGCDPNVVHGTVHTGAYNHMLGTQQGGSIGVSSATSAYHLYAVEWTEEEVVFSVDGQPYFRFENDGRGDSSTWPFNQDFHLVVNLAVGGDWGGYCGVDSGVFPQQYRLDWVRVYQ